MSEPTPTGAGPPAETYSHANATFDAQLATRSAEREAAFFLAHLRPGMTLLDMGCGPGAITLGLADAVAPGRVVGLDLRPEPLELARAAAAGRGLANVAFAVGTAYALPFPDRSFDAALAHVVLMHLREPTRALAELRRVLRPGGLVGLRDVDFGAHLVYPCSPLRAEYHALRARVQRHNGGDPELGRAHRHLLLAAGFARAEAGATVPGAGSLAETRLSAAFHRAQLAGVARLALARGWADQATLDAMAADFDAWAERPDAFYAPVYCHAVAWCPD